MKQIFFIASLTTILSILLYLNPDLDIEISRIFYDESSRSFPLRNHIISIILYKIVYVLASGIGGLCVVAFFMHIRKIESKYLPTKRFLAFILISLIIGPGIIVHWGFKEEFERARPVNIEEFGSTKKYTGPYIVSNQHGKSFISGHSSMGFFMTAFAFYFTGRKRKIAYVAGILFGTITATARVVQGAHFFSDVVLSAIITLLVIHICHYFIIFKQK